MIFDITEIASLDTLAKDFISQGKKKSLLYGDLGTGKTTFVKYFVKNLGFDDSIVSSPTYTYMNVYYDKILHLDLYRLENLERFLEMGILEYIDDFEYVFVERPKFEDYYVDDEWVKLRFYLDGKKRRVEM